MWSTADVADDVERPPAYDAKLIQPAFNSWIDVGAREAAEGKVAIRTLGQDGQRIMTIAEALAMLRAEATPPDLRG